MSNPEHELRLRAAVRVGEQSADLSNCELGKIRFSSMKLPGGNLAAANLSGADLSGAYLSDANFQGANLTKARLVLADLRRVNLRNADLTSADLSAAVLTGAVLAGAKLNRANLVKARLDGVDLTGANLQRADLRGASGITLEQIASTLHSDTAIFDERQLATLQRTSNPQIARHGAPQKSRAKKYEVDLLFRDPKPTFGDLFTICGDEHPDFPPTSSFPFAELASLGIEQTDDYFAVRIDVDPVIWIFPLIKGQVVEHDQGPFDGLRLSLDRPSYKKHWEPCVARFCEVLRNYLDR
jgi:hypothetical protein